MRGCACTQRPVPAASPRLTNAGAPQRLRPHRHLQPTPQVPTPLASAPPTRCFIPQGLGYIPDSQPELQNMLCRWTVAYSRSLMCHLRPGENLEEELKVS